MNSNCQISIIQGNAICVLEPEQFFGEVSSTYALKFTYVVYQVKKFNVINFRISAISKVV